MHTCSRRCCVAAAAVLAAGVVAFAATAPSSPTKPEPNYLGRIAANLEPTRQVVYKQVGARELHLDVFVPAGFAATDRRPAFVIIHGGGWGAGEPRSMYPWAQHAADLGMVGLSVQYRLYQPGTEVSVFECVKDARSAVRYVRAHAAELGIDPRKIVASGASAGGHLAAATALFDGVDEAGEDTTVSCRPDALVLFSPVIDTSPEGYGNAKIGERWRELSPAHQVRAGLPPTITFHGTGDKTTPFQGAQLFHDSMLQAGNRSELVSVPGAQHTYMFKDARLHADTVRRLDAFLGSLGMAAPSALSGATAPAADRVVEADFCVYGGTSGGVVAAVQAARLGQRAVVVEPGRHLGGMTAGGLSWTDVGNSDRVGAVGGLAREIYERIGAHYGQKPGTAFTVPDVAEQRRLGVDFAKPPSLAFEPHVAEAVFTQLARKAGVAVHLGQRLQSVRKNGARLREIVTADGTVFRAPMFLDATYEGDLMAAAGVSYTVGREANAQYGETLNGIQPPVVTNRAGKFEVPVDPYHTPGQPASGVLPYLLRDEPLGTVGAADRRVQSYNYRVCLTDVPANRRPLAPPAGYDPANYELLARWTEARVAAGEKLTLRSFLKYDPLQRGKYDFNNRWPISTDFLGGADAYPEAGPDERRRIARAHEDYLRGFFHFLATSPRVPAAVREEMGRFGLCRDEFTDHAGWPHQLYVREARRMVSDFVMTEPYVRGARRAPQSIGLGAYGVDMHAVRRIVVDGRPVNEGSNGGSVPRPYPIAYGAIVPRAVQCENLFVTFCLSASHVAFGSIRMEPVFMTLSQAAATAASLALDAGVPVQRVSYEQLRARLLADRVVLDWPAAAPKAKK